VNAKRLYRIMSEHNLLLLHHKPERPKREHKGKIAVAESDMRWCSDGFEFGCDNGEKLRVTFALDCCDREAIDWAASTGGYDSSTVQDVMLRSVEKRFGDRLPDTAVQWLTDNGSAYTAHETRRFAKAESGAMYNSGEQPAEQWHGRTVREDDEGRLYRVHAETGCENSPAKPCSGVHALQ
jgi:putative transposase